MPGTGTLITGEELGAALGPLDGDQDDNLEQVAAAATALLLPYLKDGDWSADPICREAALAVATQIWQARQAPGGQMVQMDYGTISLPHLLGPGLLARIKGLLGPRMQYGGLVIA